MGKLIYSAIMSLDGYTADEAGNFDWAAPDDQVHAVLNDLERPIGTYLYGRKMYEVMVGWETMRTEASLMRAYAQIWQSADKIVYSASMPAIRSARTRVERSFEPAAVRQLKQAAGRDLSIGGPTIAGDAFRAGLVDECHLIVVPVVVGGGARALPKHVRLPLELVSQRRFGSGVVHLHYRPEGVRHRRLTA